MHRLDHVSYTSPFKDLIMYATISQPSGKIYGQISRNKGLQNSSKSKMSSRCFFKFDPSLVNFVTPEMHSRRQLKQISTRVKQYSLQECLKEKMAYTNIKLLHVQILPHCIIYSLACPTFQYLPFILLLHLMSSHVPDILQSADKSVHLEAVLETVVFQPILSQFCLLLQHLTMVALFRLLQ